MSLESIKYERGKLEILDQLLLPLQTRYVKVQGVEDGWKVINKMQVSCIENQLEFSNLISCLPSVSLYLIYEIYCLVQTLIIPTYCL